MKTIIQIKQVVLTGVCLSFYPLALLFKNSLFLVFLRVIVASLIISFSGSCLSSCLSLATVPNYMSPAACLWPLVTFFFCPRHFVPGCLGPCLRFTKALPRLPSLAACPLQSCPRCLFVVICFSLPSVIISPASLAIHTYCTRTTNPDHRYLSTATCRCVIITGYLSPAICNQWLRACKTCTTQ
jgi:hypothetical protein